MKPTILFLITCIVLICIAIIGADLAGLCDRQRIQSPDTITIRKAYIVYDIQTYLMDLNNPRYDIGPKGADGKWGTDTNTAVKNFSNDESAIPWFKAMEQEK